MCGIFFFFHLIILLTRNCYTKWKSNKNNNNSDIQSEEMNRHYHSCFHCRLKNDNIWKCLFSKTAFNVVLSTILNLSIFCVLTSFIHFYFFIVLLIFYSVVSLLYINLLKLSAQKNYIFFSPSQNNRTRSNQDKIDQINTNKWNLKST